MPVNELCKELGEELAQQRQEKGLTIAQLSARTKITEGFLEKMEQGDFTFLPAVYIRAFIRTVSTEIGLDPEVMVKRFAEKISPGAAASGQLPGQDQPQHGGEKTPLKPAHQPEIMAEDITAGSRPANGGRFKSVFFMGFMLLALLAALYFILGQKPKEEPSPMDAGISIVNPVTESSSLRDAPLLPLNENDKVDTSAVDLLTLTLRAEETAWVRIVYQDSLVEEGVFTEGLTRSWMSRERFYLKIGNAGGIRLVLDGRDLGLPGEKGQVVTIVVTEEGMAAVQPASAPALLTQPRP